MLVSDKYGFIIATPTKNGTTSLQSLADKWLRDGGKSNVLRVYRGGAETKHRIAPPDGLEAYDRFMVVRDPRTRLPSMYEWLRRRPQDEPLGKSILDAEERKGTRLAGWKHMLKLFHMTRQADGYMKPGVRRLGARRPYMWTDSQVELSEYLVGRDTDGFTFLPWYREDEDPGELRTEQLEEDFHAVLDLYEPDEDQLYDLPVKQLNATKQASRIGEGWVDYYTMLGPEEQVVFDALVAEDMSVFGY